MDFNALADFIKNINRDYNVPGCDISVYYNHINVFRKHCGFSDDGGEVKVTKRNLYFMNSGAKIMCCVALMQLAQSYKITLSDKISAFLPEADDNITIRDFIKNYSALNRVEDTVYSFNNVKRIISSASGMPFDDFIYQNITKPLKMKSTVFNLNDANKKLIAKQYNYRVREKAAVECDTDVYELFAKHSGCLITNVEDYAKFCETLCGGGISKSGKRILSEQSVETLINELVYKETEKDEAFVCIGYNGSLVLIDLKKKITIVYAQHMRNMSGDELKMYPELRKVVYECIGADTWSRGYNIFP